MPKCMAKIKVFRAAARHHASGFSRRHANPGKIWRRARAGTVGWRRRLLSAAVQGGFSYNHHFTVKKTEKLKIVCT